jgi:peptidoglycan hydrolase CwlO-like protein
MTIEKPAIRLLKAVLLTTAIYSLAGCNVLSEANCDPSDATFGKSYLCGNQYASRSERLQQEVQDAAERAEQQEQNLTDLQEQQSIAQEQLAQLQRKLEASQQRIDTLRQQNAAGESQLAEVQGRLDSVQQESQTLRELQAAQASNKDNSQSDELEEQIAQLLEEEAELEALLLDLES